MDPQISQIDADSRDRKMCEIIGSAMEVHRRPGLGFLETVYHHALGMERSVRSIPFAGEVKEPVYDRGARLNGPDRVAFVCYDEVIAELNGLEAITGVEEARLSNCLEETGLQRAVLANFCALVSGSGVLSSLICEHLRNLRIGASPSIRAGRKWNPSTETTGARISLPVGSEIS